jgi:hypothetical protein
MPRRRPIIRTDHLPQTDSEPRRAVSAFNLRYEDKALVDHLQTWWALRRGASLSQPDAFSILLHAALSNPLLELPSDVQRPR